MTIAANAPRALRSTAGRWTTFQKLLDIAFRIAISIVLAMSL
jgi:hypothetical protein